METVDSKKNRIERAVRDLTKTGICTAAQARTALYAMSVAGYDFVGPLKEDQE